MVCKIFTVGYGEDVCVFSFSVSSFLHATGSRRYEPGLVCMIRSSRTWTTAATLIRRSPSPEVSALGTKMCCLRLSFSKVKYT